MPVGVNMPNLPQRQDPLDAISKALGVASQVYSFGKQFDSAKQAEELAKQEAQMKKQQAELAEMNKKGIYTPGQIAEQNTKGVGFVQEKPGMTVPRGAVKVFVAQEGGALLPGYFEKIREDKSETELQKLQLEKTRRELAAPNIPKSSEKMIASLAEKTAGKVSIKNQIDAAYAQLKDPSVPEQQKIALGQNLLKTLNSTEGADAVGAEESKRLASFLEYKIGNFRQPGSFIGRDLDQFVEQVGLTSDRLSSAIELNQKQIDDLASGKGLVQAKREPVGKDQAQGGRAMNAGMTGSKASQKSPEDMAAIEWAKKNPKNPDAIKFLKLHGVK